MRKELLENTELVHKTFPLNVFHTPFRDHDVLQLHWHEHLEWILVESGSATCRIEGTLHKVSPGDILVINTGELHSLFMPERQFSIHVLVFHPSLLGAFPAQDGSGDILSRYMSGQLKFQSLLKPGEDGYDMISEALQSLIREFDAKEAEYELTVRAWCRLLFLYSHRLFSREQPAGDQAALERQSGRFKELLEYLEEHFAERIPVQQAAAMVYLSPYYFCRRFKSITGLTYVDYVHRLRLQEADRLLGGTALTIAEIAERTGFGSINRFSKLYKTVKGFPPSRFRSNAKTRPE